MMLFGSDTQRKPMALSDAIAAELPPDGSNKMPVSICASCAGAVKHSHLSSNVVCSLHAHLSGFPIECRLDCPLIAASHHSRQLFALSACKILLTKTCIMDMSHYNSVPPAWSTLGTLAVQEPTQGYHPCEMSELT